MKNLFVVLSFSFLIIGGNPAYGLSADGADLKDYFLQVKEEIAKTPSQSDVTGYLRQRWPEIMAEQISLPFPNCLESFNNFGGTCNNQTGEKKVGCELAKMCVELQGVQTTNYQTVCETPPSGSIVNQLMTERLCLIKTTPGLSQYVQSEMDEIVRGNFNQIMVEGNEFRELARGNGSVISTSIKALMREIGDHLKLKQELTQSQDGLSLSNGQASDSPFDTLISSQELSRVWIGGQFTEVKPVLSQNPQAVWTNELAYEKAENEKWWGELKPKTAPSSPEDMPDETGSLIGIVKDLAETAKTMKSKSHPASCYPKSQFESPIMNGFTNPIPPIDGENAEVAPDKSNWQSSGKAIEKQDILVGVRAIHQWESQAVDCFTQTKEDLLASENAGFFKRNLGKLTASLIPRTLFFGRVNECEQEERSTEKSYRLVNLQKKIEDLETSIITANQESQSKAELGQIESFQQIIKDIHEVIKHLDNPSDTPVYEG